ncbi:hypothetical protein EJ05DRAFT_472081 [Pseudovirgaria hyperparasitica]|uniref:Uncharacterized protein n=1 Tax=Pseudovirgaria hyperparasitica TaxID=470096 RepID=A0A6A6WLS6_9PEZI|nr:uncharacterized protein EJ05DRAFT_472081 [Pseudovirgaria hyperparasitica]KAF2763157.1 hypothetical protein EJ05DRAFT_472081 [Pseudovirgaria hyperparasitica]
MSLLQPSSSATLCAMQRVQQHSSRKASSPTAQLLRSSRLFSIPEPLPKPSTFKANGRGSPNATLPYPVYQAIEAPLSSASRGDYGLKRPLPLRKLRRTSSPVVRLVELDAIEDVTDYELASDHVQTLHKLQELGLSISNGQRSGTFHSYSSSKRATDLNAFDDLVDASHTPILKEEDFRKYLHKIFAARHLVMRQKRALEGDAQEVEFTEKDFQAGLKKLCEEFQKQGKKSRLARYVKEFLSTQVPELLGDEMRAERTTHASAGISYLRTHKYLENHPTLGPLEHRTPVEARILRNANMPGWATSSRAATLGIAGVAIPRASGESQFRGPNSNTFDPTVQGGQKVLVHPTRMGIRPDGKITMNCDQADPAAEIIREGRLPPPKKAASNTHRDSGARMPNLDMLSTPRPPTRQEPSGQQVGLDYGLGATSSRPPTSKSDPFPDVD